MKYWGWNLGPLHAKEASTNSHHPAWENTVQNRMITNAQLSCLASILAIVFHAVGSWTPLSLNKDSVALYVYIQNARNTSAIASSYRSDGACFILCPRCVGGKNLYVISPPTSLCVNVRLVCECTACM